MGDLPPENWPWLYPGVVSTVTGTTPIGWTLSPAKPIRGNCISLIMSRSIFFWWTMWFATVIVIIEASSCGNDTPILSSSENIRTKDSFLGILEDLYIVRTSVTIYFFFTKWNRIVAWRLVTKPTYNAYPIIYTWYIKV